MDKKIINILKNGGIGVMPTDTIYGLVGSALNRKTVRKIYKIRRRNPKKPFIILINSKDDLKIFGIHPNVKTQKVLKKLWPGKVSVILPCRLKKFAYLYRGTNTLALRVPKKNSLRKLLRSTGPLVAPSANWEGYPPAKNIKEAKKYFGDHIDFYVNGKNKNTKPSTLIMIKSGQVSVLRQGSVKI
ncbi:MAG: threonylcarbamoyl-AMP synthase [Candidatus Liptonbacteria bacterium]|nr:threonylcarbamoyl-AMP synthase [Candidatus Liptonbacteria bacterium]